METIENRKMATTKCCMLLLIAMFLPLYINNHFLIINVVWYVDMLLPLLYSEMSSKGGVPNSKEDIVEIGMI